MRRIAGVVMLVMLVTPLAALAGPRQKKAAKAHIAKAAKAHQKGKFDIALVELQAAYKLDPNTELLYSLGQVYVQLGKCVEAAAVYDEFLAATKNPQAKPVVKQALAACKPSEPPPEPKPEPKPEPLPEVKATEPQPVAETKPEPKAEEPKPEPAPEPKPEPVIVAPTPEAPEPTPQPIQPVAGHEEQSSPAWYKDRVGGALVIGGALSLVAGGMVYASARGDLDDAEQTETVDQYRAELDRASSKRLISVVLVGGGAALVTAGVIRYVMRERGGSARGIGLVPARGGGLVTWMGDF